MEILSSQRVQTFLREMMDKEGDRESLISDIRVMVFPSKMDRAQECIPERSRVSYHKGRFNKVTRQISVKISVKTLQQTLESSAAIRTEIACFSLSRDTFKLSNLLIP